MNKTLLSITMAAYLSSCPDNSTFLAEKANNRELSVLQLTTRSFSLHSFRMEETFEEQASLDLHVVPASTDKTKRIPGLYRSVKAEAFRHTDGRMVWKTEEPMVLDEHPIRIYASYPYQPSATLSPASRRLRISPLARLTPDYRRGALTRGHKPVNRTCPHAMLAMEHLLSRLSFRLTGQQGKKPKCSLEAIQVGNCPGGKAFCQEAVVDLVSGRLTAFPGHPGATVFVPDSPMPIGDAFSAPGKVWVLPSVKPMEAGEIEILFTIDGKKYRYVFPKGTYWKRGYEYRYDFRLKDDGLFLVETTSVFI